MPVQAIPVTPPAQPEPSIVESLSNFIQNYWGFLLFLGVLALVIYLIYYIRRERSKKEKTSYHNIRDKIEELCSMQANRNRLKNNPLIMFGIVGVLSIIIWVGCIVLMGLSGLFIGGLFGFTVMLVGGVIYYLYSPFVKRDMVFLRYREGSQVIEKYVGDYAGEYWDSTGYLNLLVFKGRRNLIFRNKLIIRIPQSVESFYDLEKLEKDYAGEPDDTKLKAEIKKIEEKYSSFISEFVQFNDRTIVINHAKSLDKFKFMYYPVFVDELSHVINKGVRYYKSMKEQTALEQLYDITDESSKAQIKAIQINPRVQYKQATGDEVIDDVESDND